MEQGVFALWLGLVLLPRAWCSNNCSASSCLEIQNQVCDNCLGTGPFKAWKKETFIDIDAPYQALPRTTIQCSGDNMICRGPYPSTSHSNFCCWLGLQQCDLKCRNFTFTTISNRSDPDSVQVYFLWNETRNDRNDEPSSLLLAPHPPPPLSPCHSRCNSTSESCSRKACKGSSNRKVIIIGGAAAAAIAIVGAFCVIFIFARKKRLSRRKRCSSDRTQILTDAGCVYTPTVFTLKELKAATKCFAESRLLGGGGFSTVYQGKLPDGRVVAVKKLNQGNKQGIQQFQNEVSILSQVRHPNLVQLLGYCLEGRDLLLVYEFVLNGTLADHLHGGRGNGLTLETRLSIALETAQALAYLHFSAKPPIYHRDVKSSNILLDKDFKAKVADFGLSRLTHLDATHISTAPQGTPGYLDPDYHESYQLTDKSDVYSFGVVLLELISRKKAVDMTRDKKEINLASMALARIHSGALHELFDPDLSVKYWKLLTQLVEVAFRCLATEKDDRPNMLEVVRELEQLGSLVINFSSSKKSSRFKLDQTSGELKKQRSLASNILEQESPTSVQIKWPSTHTSPSNSRSEV